MGFQHDDNDEQRRLAAPDADADANETLPLYHEVNDDLDLPLHTPDPKAGPDKVRDYLVRVMCRRGVHLDHARRVAARWNLGTGQEVRSYPVAMYREIFGSEDAWAVYKGVKAQQYAEEREKDVAGRWMRILGLPVMLLIFFSAVAVLANASRLPAFAIFIGVMFAMLTGFFGLPLSIALLCMNRDPEHKADQELQSEWHKTSRSSQ